MLERGRMGDWRQMMTKTIEEQIEEAKEERDARGRSRLRGPVMTRYLVTYSITGTASTYVEADSEAEAREKAGNYETTGETDIDECELDVWHGDLTEVPS